MSKDQKLSTSRLGRVSKLAVMGLRSGAGMLLGRGDGGAAQAAEVLGSLRGLAAKVGQMASYVDGVVPEAQREAYGAALQALQAQAARSSSTEIRKLVENELRAPIDQLFSEWEDTPIASASIGQVHRARLLTGEVVAVKAQHPGIEHALSSDLDNAGLLEGIVDLTMGKRVGTKAMLDIVRKRFREELDYTLEAERLSAFATLHEHDATIRVPHLYASHSSRRVLTTAFEVGQSFEEVCRESEAARRAWAETMWRFVFKGVLRGGLLAADPHPGNYIFQPDGRIVFLDYGCVQPLDDGRRDKARAVHEAALARDLVTFDRAALRMVDAKPGPLEPLAIQYVRACFQPLLASPYRVTREYAGGLLTLMKDMARESLKVKDSEFFGMPPDMVFVNRLQFGFYSVLARLDVEVNYAAVERAFLKDGA